jgi:hypothetical protein
MGPFRFARFAVLTMGISVSLPLLAEKAPDIPAGTTLKVRIIDNLSSETAATGDTFHGTLDEPVMAADRDLYPKGADVSGRVSYVHRSGRLSDPGELDLVLTTISSGSMTSSVSVQPLVIKGESHSKSNATKIGGGAALGAIIGAIAGGGKGAAIGAGVGGAAGTGAAAATGKKEASVESEAVLTFTTSSAVSSPPSGNGPGAASTSSTPPTATSGSPTDTSTSASQATSSSQPASLFSLRDRRVIRSCVAEHASELPPGTVTREEMPTGEERDLHQGGTLSADVLQKAQALPLACERQLPALASDQERVLYKGRAMLANSSHRILDVFDLEGSN